MTLGGTATTLSVALPVRNGADYLRPALDSILTQSFADFELVVSDNASTDATPDILADYAHRDSRVKPYRSTESLSQMANCNRAVSLTSSPWVKLFCHDDLMLDGCLARIHALVEEVNATNVGLIGNGERYLFANGYLAENDADGPPLRLSGRDAIRGFFGLGPRFGFPALTTATVRKAAFDATGGFDPRFVHFDIFLWLQLLVAHDFAYLPQPLTVNRIHGRQVAVQSRASLREVKDFRAFFPDYIRRNGAALNLSRTERMRARAKPVATAATSIATQTIAGRWQVAAAMFRALPAAWWLPVAALAIRQRMKEQQRTGPLRRHVPAEMVYP